MLKTMENPKQLIRSWALQGSFANGSVSEDKLVPKEFTRIRTPFVNTWREEQLASTLQFGSQGFSWFCPESLRVVSSMFLKVNLPALNSGVYKSIPGMHVIDRLRFLTQGSEAYFVQPALFLRDYMESLTERECKRFAKTFLGYKDTQDGAARTILIPILLPNSAYLFRNGRDARGHGVFPAYLGNNRLEIQFTLASGSHLVPDQATAPSNDSIQNQCSVMIHQVEMQPRDIERYSDSRGAYSVMTRRFTEVTTGWTNVAANTRHKVTQAQPIGNVTELFCVAVPSGTAEAQRDIVNQVPATHFGITSDSVIQKQLDSPEKVQLELWQNGFTGNDLVEPCSRLCFAAHAAEAENLYSGAFNMAHSSNISIDIEFGAAVDIRIYAVQLQRVVIDADGNILSSLD